MFNQLQKSPNTRLVVGASLAVFAATLIQACEEQSSKLMALVSGESQQCTPDALDDFPRISDSTKVSVAQMEMGSVALGCADGAVGGRSGVCVPKGDGFQFDYHDPRLADPYFNSENGIVCAGREGENGGEVCVSGSFEVDDGETLAEIVGKVRQEILEEFARNSQEEVLPEEDGASIEF